VLNLYKAEAIKSLLVSPVEEHERVKEPERRLRAHF